MDIRGLLILPQQVRLLHNKLLNSFSLLHSECLCFRRSVKTDPSYTSEEEIEDVLEMLPQNSSFRRKPTLRKQFSVLEVPLDECGFKMTHWV